MTARDKTYLKREIGQDLADNTTGDITPDDVRTLLTDITDSMALETALAAKADLASPTFSGNPKAPTPLSSDDDTQIATKKYVDDNGGAGVNADWNEGDSNAASYIENKPTLPAKASNADVDDETDDSDYTTVLKVFRAIARKVKNASTTVRGIVFMARNADVDATETDTTRALSVATGKRLIARVAGILARDETTDLTGTMTKLTVRGTAASIANDPDDASNKILTIAQHSATGGLLEVSHDDSLTGSGASASPLAINTGGVKTQHVGGNQIILAKLATDVTGLLLPTPTRAVGDAGKALVLNADATAYILAALYTDARADARVSALVSAWARGTGQVPDASIPAGITRDTEFQAAIADFLSGADIDTRISTALAGYVRDADTYASATAYAADVIVRHGGNGTQATYMSIREVPANTAAATEPGVGTQWERFWDRLGYENGPPNAFSGATLVGSLLTLSREGGTNPVEITLPGGASGDAAALADSRSEYIGITADVTVGDNAWEKITPYATSPTVEYGDGDAQIITRDDDDTLTIAAGVYTVWFEGLIHPTGSNERSAPTFKIQADGGTDVYARSDKDYDRNDEVGSNGLHYTISAKLVFNADTAVEIYGGSDPDLSGITAGNPSGKGFTFDHDDFRITLVPAGGKLEPQFITKTIGTATFDLDGSAGNLALQDADSNALVVPGSGWIIATYNIPSLGLRGDSVWVRNEQLEAATASSDISGGLYTNSSNEIFFEFAQQQAASTDNTILLEHVTTTLATPTNNTNPPTISLFNVTGDFAPAAGSIAGDVYHYSLSISQPDHVTAARIVGFAGTDVSSATIAVLKSVSDYHGETGQVTIPAGITLAAGGSYTIRLEVYGQGQTVGTDTPVANHHVRITARAASGEVHFGRIRTDQAAGDIVFATHDISQSGTAAGTYLISGIPDDSHDYHLYWAVPTSLTQPAHWTTSNFNADNGIDAPVSRTIGSVDYSIYVTDIEFDNTANGSSFEVTT